MNPKVMAFSVLMTSWCSRLVKKRPLNAASLLCVEVLFIFACQHHPPFFTTSRRRFSCGLTFACGFFPCVWQFPFRHRMSFCVCPAAKVARRRSLFQEWPSKLLGGVPVWANSHSNVSKKEGWTFFKRFCRCRCRKYRWLLHASAIGPTRRAPEVPSG